jgi:dTDP-4-amino-4,6-dideoxygalactose transaminase
VIPLFKVHMPREVLPALEQTLFSGQVAQGPRVDEFEAQLERWTGRPTVTVNSGTAALHLAMRLADVGPGTTVVVSPMTCTATIQPALALGAKLDWCDIDPTTGNMSSSALRTVMAAHAHGGRHIVVVFVHWGGASAGLAEVAARCREHRVPLIEDAAQAFGAPHKEVRGDFVCYSFQAIKTINTGDGGALTCARPGDYERAQRLRWFGLDRSRSRGRDAFLEQDITEHGYKFHMNDIAATIGLAQLDHVDKLVARQRDNARYYYDRWRSCKRRLFSPVDVDTDNSSCWLSTWLVDDRESFRAFMTARGVEVSQVHVRNDRYSLFLDATWNHRNDGQRRRERLPGVDEFASRQSNIPVGWWVTDEQRAHVFDSMVAWSEGVEHG